VEIMPKATTEVFPYRVAYLCLLAAGCFFFFFFFFFFSHNQSCTLTGYSLSTIPMSTIIGAPSMPAKGIPSGHVRERSVDLMPRGLRLVDNLTTPTSTRSGVDSPFGTEPVTAFPFILRPRDRLAEDDTQTSAPTGSSTTGRSASGEHSGSPTKKLKLSYALSSGSPTKLKASPDAGHESRTIGPNPRKRPQAFRKWLMHRGGFHTNDVKEVFRIYDWQQPRAGQDPQVLDRIEELLKLRGARWPTPEIRAALLSSKVFAVLDAVMERLGWVCGWGFRDETTGKSKIAYAPANPKHPRTRGLPN
jgi:hypothetical protein